MKKIIFILAVALPAFSAHADTINFAYRIIGDRMVAPMQAFDDGYVTYLQSRDLQHPPVILNEDGNPVQYVVTPPYIVVTGVHNSLLLHYGKHQAFLTNAMQNKIAKSTPTQPITGANLWFGDAKPSAITGNAEKPISAAAYFGKTRTETLPLSSPAYSSTSLTKNVKGQFFIEKYGSYNTKELFPSVKSTYKDSGVSLSFADGATVSPHHIVMLYKFVNSSKRNAKYTVAVGTTDIAKKRGINVGKALERVGVRTENIIMVTSESDDLIVNIEGAK